MTLACGRGSETLFTVNDFADYIAVSGDGRYIVGLSNRGMTNLFWIRDALGTTIERRTDVSHYCSKSVTNVLEWFDAKNPNFRFQFKDSKLAQVLVRGCDGRDLQLLK